MGSNFGVKTTYCANNTVHKGNEECEVLQFGMNTSSVIEQFGNCEPFEYLLGKTPNNDQLNVCNNEYL